MAYFVDIKLINWVNLFLLNFICTKSTVYEKEISTCITHITTNCNIRHLHITKQFVFWIKCSCVSKSYMYCIIRKYFISLECYTRKFYTLSDWPEQSIMGGHEELSQDNAVAWGAWRGVWGDRRSVKTKD